MFVLKTPGKKYQQQTEKISKTSTDILKYNNVKFMNKQNKVL